MRYRCQGRRRRARLALFLRRRGTVVRYDVGDAMTSSAPNRNPSAACVPVGVFFVSVATGAVGIVLGVAGYALGARRFGGSAVVLCTVAMLLGLLIGQGAMPGSYDAVLDGVKETIQDPLPER